MLYDLTLSRIHYLLYIEYETISMNNNKPYNVKSAQGPNRKETEQTSKPVRDERTENKREGFLYRSNKRTLQLRIE